MINKLEATILDQHARVQAAGENGHEVLGEVKGEIMAAANPAQVQEILTRTLEVARWLTDPATSHLAGVQAEDSLPRTLARLGGGLYELSRGGLVVPSQGYVGLVTINSSRQALDVFGFSAEVGQILKEDDPIQKACGSDFFYPPMMWAKALYSEAYKNRSESQKNLPIHVWLAELAGEGVFQGSMPTDNGLLGSTGFMPSGGQRGMMAKLKRTSKRKGHLEAEQVKPFRASGLMDQASLAHLTSDVGIDQTEVVVIAGHILRAEGSLN